MAHQYRAVLIAVATAAVLLALWHFRVDFIWSAAASCFLVAAAMTVDCHKVEGGAGGLMGTLSKLYDGATEAVKSITVDESEPVMISDIMKQLNQLKAEIKEELPDKKNCNTADEFLQLHKRVIGKYGLVDFRDSFTYAPDAKYQTIFVQVGDKYSISPGIAEKILLNISGKIDEVDKIPFNIFAKIADDYNNTGKSNVAPYGDYISERFPDSTWRDKFFLARNLAINDQNWDNPNKKSSASMSRYHRFLILRDLNWQTFNVLTMTRKHVLLLEEMANCARHVAVHEINAMETKNIDAENQNIDAENRKEYNYIKHRDIGIYFHCWPHNSVNALHLHIVDKRYLGPAFHYHAWKNLPLDEVITAIKNFDDIKE